MSVVVNTIKEASVLQTTSVSMETNLQDKDVRVSNKVYFIGLLSY